MYFPLESRNFISTVLGKKKKDNIYFAEIILKIFSAFLCIRIDLYRDTIALPR